MCCCVAASFVLDPGHLAGPTPCAGRSEGHGGGGEEIPRSQSRRAVVSLKPSQLACELMLTLSRGDGPQGAAQAVLWRLASPGSWPTVAERRRKRRRRALPARPFGLWRHCRQPPMLTSPLRDGVGRGGRRPRRLDRRGDGGDMARQCVKGRPGKAQRVETRDGRPLLANRAGAMDAMEAQGPYAERCSLCA